MTGYHKIKEEEKRTKVLHANRIIPFQNYRIQQSKMK